MLVRSCKLGAVCDLTTRGKAAELGEPVEGEDQASTVGVIKFRSGNHHN